AVLCCRPRGAVLARDTHGMGLFDKFKQALGGDDPEIRTLVAKLKDPDWKTRFEAAQKLGELGSKATPAMPALEEAISDDNGEVCRPASDALSKIRRPAH